MGGASIYDWSVSQSEAGAVGAMGGACWQMEFVLATGVAHRIGRIFAWFKNGYNSGCLPSSGEVPKFHYVFNYNSKSGDAINWEVRLNNQQRTFNTSANRVRENLSYSRALNPHPQQEMAPRIPSIENSQPTDNPTNAFKDMAEGLAELKKLMREFPNLFSALKELKTAKDSTGKLKILMKAFDNSGTSVSG
ncbi:hypothetical protein AVEN_121894-1 [Araneus ventricosus]|uniref:Uncharacterized protein n=1 Tax=Araneus ventricosus TaxID=182803 RepID=A0A4Y2TGW5_ARAVE|nr:hypothetical protein AVEN_121894-1 [Araneus ventricosus]